MRTIDADALKRDIGKYHDGLKPRYISKLVDAEIADIRDIIDEQPAIDAVEVIRCKDCKHRNRYYCYHPEQMYLAVDIDYYCARGERRDP